MEAVTVILTCLFIYWWWYTATTPLGSGGPLPCAPSFTPPFLTFFQAEIDSFTDIVHLVSEPFGFYPASLITCLISKLAKAVIKPLFPNSLFDPHKMENLKKSYGTISIQRVSI